MFRSSLSGEMENMTGDSSFLFFSSVRSAATTALKTSQSPKVMPMTDLSSSPSSQEARTAPLRFCAVTAAQ